MANEIQVHPQTILQHKIIYNWAISQNIKKYKKTKLFDSEFAKLKSKYFYKYKSKKLRLLIHCPPLELSAGGYSLFSNIAESAEFMGIKAQLLNFNEDPIKIIKKFRPTIFLTSDNKEYLDKINWDNFLKLKKQRDFLFGLSASTSEDCNHNLKNRIKLAKDRGVDFYYSFRNQDYVKKRKAYKPFFDAGFRVHSLEFASNPLRYFPLENIMRDLNYVFLASTNKDKWQQYDAYLFPIAKKAPGFINGPGWLWSRNSSLTKSYHPFVYARARIGINLHIPISIKQPSELNERVYILACSGVPQLTDNARLLGKYFAKDSLYIAKNPQQYKQLFFHILKNPNEAQLRADKALKTVLRKHTYFHRIDNFFNQLTKEKYI